MSFWAFFKRRYAGTRSKTVRFSINKEVCDGGIVPLSASIFTAPLKVSLGLARFVDRIGLFLYVWHTISILVPQGKPTPCRNGPSQQQGWQELEDRRLQRRSFFMQGIVLS